MAKEIVKKLYEATNARDKAAAEALLREDFTQHDANSPAGKAGYFAKCADLWDDPAVRLEIAEIFQDAEGNVCAYVKAKKDGVTVIRIADIFEVRDGLVAAQWSMRQHYSV